MTAIPYIRFIMEVRPAGILEMGSMHYVKKQHRRAPILHSFRRISMYTADFFQTVINTCKPKASHPCNEYKKS